MYALVNRKNAKFMILYTSLDRLTIEVYRQGTRKNTLLPPATA